MKYCQAGDVTFPVLYTISSWAVDSILGHLGCRKPNFFIVCSFQLFTGSENCYTSSFSVQRWVFSSFTQQLLLFFSKLCFVRKILQQPHTKQYWLMKKNLKVWHLLAGAMIFFLHFIFQVKLLVRSACLLNYRDFVYKQIAIIPFLQDISLPRGSWKNTATFPLENIENCLWWTISSWWWE